MLTKVILEGPMGKKFGRVWELVVASPNEALQMIDANKPGLFAWIKGNLDKYEKYKVIVETDDGDTRELSNEDYQFECRAKTIRFAPVVEGSGGSIGNFVFGAVLFAIGFFFPPAWSVAANMLMGVGLGMMLGGIIQMLTPQPKADQAEGERKDKTSYYFDGPANTTMQGVPVQLIYGEEVMVGSHAISSSVEIDQLL